LAETAGRATQALLLSPAGVAVDSAGNIYVADLGNNRIRKINASGVISTIAGGGSGNANGVAATSVALSAPAGIAVDSTSNVYFTEGGLNSS
jgi:sugar lactone lactonase YvrE